MDFAVGVEGGLLGVESGLSALCAAEGEAGGGLGSGCLKRPSGLVEDECRSFKMAKASKWPSSLYQEQQFLDFSSGKSEASVVTTDGLFERSLQNGSLGFYHPSASYGRNAGLSQYGVYNGGMHGVLTGSRGPFTSSQWMELERQALIYKHLNANVPVPPNLIMSIQRSPNPAGFSGFPLGSLRPNTLGWGSFHLAFSGSTDPEPGRCRRTDGKKWRCSRDAVPDQKYCERHMNRGRHRSRKPVEGHPGHATAGNSGNAKALPISSASAGGSSGGTSNSVAINHQHIKNSQTSSNPSTPHIGRIDTKKSNMNGLMEDSQALSMKDIPLSILEHQKPFQEVPMHEFGLVTSDSLLNPVKSSCNENQVPNTSSDLCQGENRSHPLRHFIDNWPNGDHSANSWPEVEESRSDRTQLSISIPLATSDFSSSTSSPTHDDKLTLSPLKFSHELDPVQMGLAVGGMLYDANQRQTNWVPITQEASMGGPLGEALSITNTPAGDLEHSSTLNLRIDGWDASPRVASSSTGVLHLQKSTFVSLSNSSTASSPRGESYKNHDINATFYENMSVGRLL